MNLLRKLALDVLYTLREAGAEQADCTIKFTSRDESNSLGKSEYLLREYESCDIEMTAEKDGKRAVITMNQTDPTSLLESAKLCVASTACGLPAEKPLRFKGSMGPDQLLPLSRDPQKLYRRFEELMNTLRDDYPNVSSDAMISYTDEKLFYINTDGFEYTNHRQECYCGWQGNIRGNNEVTDCNFFSVNLLNLDDEPIINKGTVRKKLDELGNMLGARPIGKGKFKGTLILCPSEAGSLAFQIANRVKKQEKDDHLPDPSCSSCISICNVFSDKPFVNGEAVENSPRAVKEYSIKKGEIVESPEKGLEGSDLDAYHQNRLVAMEGLNYSAFCVEAGQTPLKELIQAVKQGLLVQNIQGTLPMEDGEIAGVAKNSYYIQEGKILFPVVETMICGNVFEMFKHVVGISKEVIVQYGNAIPWIAVDGAIII